MRFTPVDKRCPETRWDVGPCLVGWLLTKQKRRMAHRQLTPLTMGVKKMEGSVAVVGAISALRSKGVERMTHSYETIESETTSNIYC